MKVIEMNALLRTDGATSAETQVPDNGQRTDRATAVGRDLFDENRRRVRALLRARTTLSKIDRIALGIVFALTLIGGVAILAALGHAVAAGFNAASAACLVLGSSLLTSVAGTVLLGMRRVRLSDVSPPPGSESLWARARTAKGARLCCVLSVQSVLILVSLWIAVSTNVNFGTRTAGILGLVAQWMWSIAFYISAALYVENQVRLLLWIAGRCAGGSSHVVRPGLFAYDGAVAVAAVVCVALLLNNAVIAPARRLDAFAEQADRLAAPGRLLREPRSAVFSFGELLSLPSCPVPRSKPITEVFVPNLPRSPGLSKHLEQELGEVPKALSSLRVDIFPPIAETTEPTPLILFFHPGGFVGGTRKVALEGINGCMVEYFTSRGFAVASPDYRLLGHGWNMSTILGDGLAALAHLLSDRTSALGMIDREAVFVAGASAGAEMALSVGFSRAASVAGIINLYGAYDRRIDCAPGYDDPVTYKIWCGGATKCAAIADCLLQRSPRALAGADAPPVLTLHGAFDTLTGPDQVNVLDEDLRAWGVPHLRVIVPMMPHMCDTAAGSACQQALFYAQERFMAHARARRRRLA